MKLMIWIGLSLMLTLTLINVARATDVPQPGQPAPEFELYDQAGKLQKLSDYRNKWVVLYFYPKDDSPHCTTQACQFRDDISQIHTLGAEVVGISVDDKDSHAEFAKKHHLPFPLLVDKDGLVAAKYGSISNWLVIKFAKRNTFIINPEGNIAKVYLSVDAAKNPQQVVTDLTALQATHH